ncbi:MAG TPA: hypothetical protein VK179_15420 [Bacteroidales bacterium]|nr:hypothetical protein [Bacteroidales bacterium]
MRLKFFILLLCLCAPMVAQDYVDIPVINAWIEGGAYRVRPVLFDRTAGVDLALKFQYNRVLSEVQYMDIFDSEHTELGLFDRQNHYHAFNFLLGITNRECKSGHVSISSGLGLFYGEITEQETEHFATIGLPVEAAVSLNLGPIAGLQLRAFTNLNFRHSFYGLGMDIQLGKMRRFL